MNFSLEYHWLFLSIGTLLVLWGASLLAVRLWTRHQVIHALMRQEGAPEEVRIVLPDPHPKDLAALELIRSYRRRYLLRWWPGTAISFKAINDMSMELIREIARVYHPDEDRPELKASLADLVALHNRVGTRLAAWLETVPMRPFKDVELGTVVRYHEMYQNLKSHWGLAFIKRHHLDKVVQWGWTALITPIPGIGAARPPTTGAKRWRLASSWPGWPTWWVKKRCGFTAGGGASRS